MPRPERDFALLSRGARRRWIGQYGGPRSLGPERRAERARLAYERGAHLAPEHTGHAGPYEATFSALPTTSGVQEVTVRSLVEASRAGEYGADVGLLLDGELSPAQFRRRWRRRVRKLGDFELEATPDRVIAMVTEAGPPPEPFYRRSAAAGRSR